MESWHTGLQTIFELPLASEKTSWYGCTNEGFIGIDLGPLSKVNYLIRKRNVNVEAHLPDKLEATTIIINHYVHSQMYITQNESYYLNWIYQENEDKI